jgi:hypothetical protein
MVTFVDVVLILILVSFVEVCFFGGCACGSLLLLFVRTVLPYKKLVAAAVRSYRKEIYDLRKSEKADKQESRAASVVNSDVEAVAKRGNAGEQFGGQAHVLKKQKAAYIASLEKQLQEAKSSL